MTDAEAMEQEQAILYSQLTTHECGPYLEIRLRKPPGQPKHHYVRQCQVCGEQRGGAIAQKTAAELLVGALPKDFDNRIQTRHATWRKEKWGKWEQLRDEIAALTRGGSSEPHQHSDVTMWLEEKDRRATKAAAELHACSTNVIRLVGEAEAFRLLTREVERLSTSLRAEGAKKVNRFRGELELRAWLDSWLEQDFEVYQEVPGTHIFASNGVQIDYVLIPKSHLVEAGFKDSPIGLEVKYLDQDGGFTRKASRAVWQAVSYAASEFMINSVRSRLSTVLLFSNLSFEEEIKLLRTKDSGTMSDRSEWSALLGVANHAGVGVLQALGTRDSWKGWAITFGGGVYFRRTEAHDGVRYIAGNSNLVDKVRVGNF